MHKNCAAGAGDDVVKCDLYGVSERQGEVARQGEMKYSERDHNVDKTKRLSFGWPERMGEGGRAGACVEGDECSCFLSAYVCAHHGGAASRLLSCASVAVLPPGTSIQRAHSVAEHHRSVRCAGSCRSAPAWPTRPPSPSPILSPPRAHTHRMGSECGAERGQPPRMRVSRGEHRYPRLRLSSFVMMFRGRRSSCELRCMMRSGTGATEQRLQPARDAVLAEESGVSTLVVAGTVACSVNKRE